MGFQVIRDIVITPAPANPDAPLQPVDNKWGVPVQTGKKALLEQAASRLVFYKQAMPVVAHPEQVAAHYQQLIEGAQTKAETPAVYDFAVPTGRDRQVDRYYSVQNHLPTVYGLSPSGISTNAGEPRQALAYQLKAYLLFFDQIMANYLRSIEPGQSPVFYRCGSPPHLLLSGRRLLRSLLQNLPHPQPQRGLPIAVKPASTPCNIAATAKRVATNAIAATAFLIT